MKLYAPAMLKVGLVLTVSLIAGCMQQQPQPQYAQQGQYGQQQGQYGQQQGTYNNEQGPYAQQQQPAYDANAPRHITINGQAASPRDLQTIHLLEQQWGIRAQDGDYWYDNMTGATGRWGGPMVSLLPANLQLGGPLPPNASGGGNGTLTGVFINGRELHPYDVQRLEQITGTRAQPSRWWLDGQGNFGLEGGGMMGNLYALAKQRSGGNGGGSYYSSDQNGSVFAGGGCVAATSSSGASYYSAGCD